MVSQLPECGPSKTLSNSKNGLEVIKIANKICRQKCIWIQSSNLRLKSQKHITTEFQRDSRISLNADFPRHFHLNMAGACNIFFTCTILSETVAVYNFMSNFFSYILLLHVMAFFSLVHCVQQTLHVTNCVCSCTPFNLPVPYHFALQHFSCA